jgi:hypothetical protein
VLIQPGPQLAKQGNVVFHPQNGLGPSGPADYAVATKEQRYVAIHYHILKNAGTTVESILQREFGETFVRLHGTAPGAILTSAHATEFLTQHPGVRAVSSHHLTYPLPQPPDTVVFDICFLRDPIERLVSYYEHLRRAPDRDPLIQLAQEMNIEKFLAVLVGQCPHLVNDVQVNRLANAGRYTRSPNRMDLAKAAEIVCRMSVAGVVDLFDESCVAAEYALGPAFPGLRMHYSVRQNASPREAEAGPRSGEAIGAALLRTLQERNQLDYELLHSAREEVSRRFQLVPQHSERLQEFRERCAVSRLPALTSSAGR